MVTPFEVANLATLVSILPTHIVNLSYHVNMVTLLKSCHIGNHTSYTHTVNLSYHVSMVTLLKSLTLPHW